MIKAGTAVFHPDPSVLSGEDFPKVVAQMRQSLCRIQKCSDSISESVSYKFQSEEIGRKKAEEALGRAARISSRIVSRK